MAAEGAVNGNRRKRERTVWAHMRPYGPVYYSMLFYMIYIWCLHCFFMILGGCIHAFDIFDFF